MQGEPSIESEDEDSPINNTLTGWTGDVDFGNMFSGMFGGRNPSNNEMQYMLGAGIDPRIFGSGGYNYPFTGNFEMAMNYPSNPSVNPINNMNPQQYSESLFGPNVTPMMAQQMCKNFSDYKSEKDNNNNNNNNNNNANDLRNNLFNQVNSQSSTMLAQNSGSEEEGSASRIIDNGNGNGNVNGNSNSNGEACPPCGRCPETNYECKLTPKYEQGYNNGTLPRAVLTDFSTFGM